MKRLAALFLLLCLGLCACAAEPVEFIEEETAIYIALNGAEDYSPVPLTTDMATCELDSGLYWITFAPDALQTQGHMPEILVILDALTGEILETTLNP